MSCGKVITVGTTTTLAPPGVSLGSAAGSAISSAATTVAPVLAGVAAAAGAVLLTRAALSGLAALDEKFTAMVEQRTAQEEEARRWQMTYADVLAHNARILRLRETARRLGPDVGPVPPLPDPFDPQRGTTPTRDLVALQAWCARVQASLDAAEAQLRTARFVAACGPQPGDTPAAVRARERLHRELARNGRLVEQRRRDDTGHRTSSVDPAPGRAGAAARPDAVARLRTTVDGLLSGLVDDVSPEDYVVLTTEAEAVLDAPDRGAAADALDLLFYHAQQCREAQKDRARNAAQAAEYLAAIDGPGPLPRGAEAVVARLHAVVADEASLDDALRSSADLLLRWRAKDTEDRYTLEAVRAAFELSGYHAVVESPVAGARPTLALRHETDGPSVEFTWAGSDLAATCTDTDPALVARWAEDARACLGHLAAEGVDVSFRETAPVPATAPAQRSDAVDGRPTEDDEAEDDRVLPVSQARPTPC
jgi:hypothetical protein